MARLLRYHVALQAIVIASYGFVPLDGWVHIVWQVVAGWGAAVVVVGSARRAAGPAALPWYLFGGGIFLNATGPLVDRIAKVGFAAASPNVGDLFWLALFPGLIAGMAVIVYRRSVRADFGTLALGTLVSTIITTVLGMLAWDLVIRPEAVNRSVVVLDRIVVVAYPVGDLVVLSLMLRLLLGGGRRNAALRLMLGSLCCFLGVDAVWAVHVQSGVDPSSAGEHLLEMGSMSAYALAGAAALHPAMRALTVPAPEQDARSRRPAVAALAVSALIAPIVLGIEALLDLVYDVVGR
jgi:hypothetical protein